MPKLLYFLLFISACIKLLAEETPSKEFKLEKITKNIVALEEEKSRYQKVRAKHLDKGALWQFHKDHSLESKQEYALAEKEWDKIRWVELKIHRLLSEKQELLEE